VTDTTTAPTVIAAAARNATKIYGQGDTQVTALDDVSVDFGRGQFTAIMGPSGSGKSTLMHCLAGLDRLTSGQVFIAGVELTTLDEKGLTQLRRDQIGFIFQAFNLIPTLSAIENITLPMDLGGRDPDKGWLDQVVTTVGLADRLSHRPSELSGGQQQRVAIARALVNEPAVLFADEPTGNLDTASTASVMQALVELNEQLGVTILFVSHDPDHRRYAKHLIYLRDGRLSEPYF